MYSVAFILTQKYQINQLLQKVDGSILSCCWDDRWSNVNRRIREYPCYATANREKCAILRQNKRRIKGKNTDFSGDLTILESR